MKTRTISTSLVALAVLSTATACSDSKQPEASTAATGTTAVSSTAPAKLAPVTLKGMLFGDPPKDMQLVMDEFEKRTKDTLNTKLNIQWNPAADHKQKVKLMMTAGEDIDFVFDADFMNLKELVPQGAYAQLDKYFNNDAYPGLKKAFTPEFVAANKRFDNHLYTIPFTQYFYDLPVVYIRKDLREKYGFGKINSYEDLENYYKKVQENDKTVTPLAVSGNGGFQEIWTGEPSINVPNMGTVGISGIPFLVQLSDDGKKVQNMAALGDEASAFAKLPAPFNTAKTAFPQYDKWAEWSKYLEKDVISQKDSKAYFMSGKAASYYGTISSFAADRKKLKDAISTADLEFFVLRKDIRDMKPHAISTSYRSNNSIAIPATSKNIDRTMKYFDWLFSSQENHDLFEYGIPGKHWEAVGSNQIKLLDESKNYIFNGFEMTWNPNMIRLSQDLDDTSRKYFEYSAKTDTYYSAPLAMFTFDNTNVKAEVASITSKTDPFIQLLKAGQIKDWEAQTAKLSGELKALGMDKVRAELQKQIQAYLDKGGK
ncbi:ABC transporter substrate-binding protein [Paenibacillus pectinilyticus]|uniref:ABC transporter substrate-binding protein n=1 Tax=Paenibacillus pectinilyticus TaxID=512399 RepID=A0A1C0ZVN7_9BACL|nr:ABC transporter substrate-binding protein [Paenibacillus pectinilyticus]OCT12172.1 ABC transporter substrate-binding protein [Paenibacillus pectinilyticus]